jgi:hypothetical protein
MANDSEETVKANCKNKKTMKRVSQVNNKRSVQPSSQQSPRSPTLQLPPLVVTNNNNKERPLSSRKYKTLPSIASNLTKLNSQVLLHSEFSGHMRNLKLETPIRMVTIGLRLPNGARSQKDFKFNDKMQDVLNFAVAELGEKEAPSDYCLLYMPNELVDSHRSIDSYGICDRTMLFLISKHLL